MLIRHILNTHTHPHTTCIIIFIIIICINKGVFNWTYIQNYILLLKTSNWENITAPEETLTSNDNLVKKGNLAFKDTLASK